MNTVRRLRDDKEGPWHFCGNCSQFPEHGVDERLEIPEGGTPCSECEQLQKDGKCS